MRARLPAPRRAHLGPGHGVQRRDRAAHPLAGRWRPHGRARHPRPPSGRRACRRCDRGGGARVKAVLAVLGIVPTSARAIIPLGSMIIASAMNTTSLVMVRLREDLAAHRREVEARLSLGQTGHQAAAPWHRAAMRTAMLPTIDQTKVVGLVALPGAMTGMILAGASATQAIRLQLVVMYMLLGGNAFAALVAGEATVRRLFTSHHQLVRSLRRVPI